MTLLEITNFRQLILGLIIFVLAIICLLQSFKEKKKETEKTGFIPMSPTETKLRKLLAQEVKENRSKYNHELSKEDRRKRNNRIWNEYKRAHNL